MKNPAYIETSARLKEAFNHWHSSAEHYFQPDAFRISLNACIQFLRNVTFVLQNNKSKIDSFEQWYEGWQSALRNDPIMKWCVSARNHIVKQGDLRTHSIALVNIHISYDEPPTHTFHVNPFYDSQAIASYIRKEKLSADFKKYGYMRVERQWIASDIPKLELLSILAHSYSVLGSLVQDIHKKYGSPCIYTQESSEDDTFLEAYGRIKTEDKPLCMQDFEKYRIAWLKLSTGEIVVLEKKEVTQSSAMVTKAVKRYGLKDVRFKSQHTGLIGQAEHLLEIGKTILKKDRHHHPVIFLIDDDGVGSIHRTVFDDNEDKYLFWEEMAIEVEGKSIKTVIVITDIWISILEDGQPTRRAEDDPKRTEAMQVIATNRNGENVVITAPYTRRLGKIVFQPNRIEQPLHIGFLDPIHRVWKKNEKR